MNLTHESETELILKPQNDIFVSESDDIMTLKGKTALITGGTGALGHVVAERFIREGCNVATTYLFEDELMYRSDDYRKNVFIDRADVTDYDELAALFHGAIRKYG